MAKKIRYIFYIVGIILIIFSTVYAYFIIKSLPNTVPTQIGYGGAITNYGNKYTIFILPAIMLVCLFIPLLYRIPFKKGRYHISDIGKEKVNKDYVSKTFLSAIFVGISTFFMLLFLFAEFVCLYVETR